MRVKIIFPVLTAAMIIFIWAHSFMSADLSSEESGFVTEIIKNIFHITGDNTEGIVRKCAHFSEYAILGILIAADGILYLSRPITLISVFSGLLTAHIDETIQLFTPGRSGEILDVWIDFSGCITGLVFIAVIYYILRYKPKKA